MNKSTKHSYMHGHLGNPDTSDQMFHIVQSLLQKRTQLLDVVKKHQTPCYIYDKEALKHDLDTFRDTFLHHIPRFTPYYAFKINHYEKIAKEAILHGYGLDVASGRELSLALRYGCRNIIYYSPGKTDEDLLYAVKNNKDVRIHIDSFNELERLGTITNRMKKTVKAGIRIHMQSMKQWIKFGIDLNDLYSFWRHSKNYPYIHLEGIHFHTSRNSDATPYIRSIQELGTYIRNGFSETERNWITYIDIGGGFEPYRSEGYYPYEFSQDATINSHSSYDDIKRRFSDTFQMRKALPISAYAKHISEAIKTYIDPYVHTAYVAEPGRIICNNAMHIVLSIVDIKNDSVAILDGGINMVGWQRYMYEYFPVINLTHPSFHKILCTMYGKLCTTRDLWGYTCYTDKIQIGDTILIPNQGALTYSIAQNWILGIPKVYCL